MALKLFKVNIITFLFSLLLVFNCSSQDNSISSSLSLIGENIDKVINLENQLKSKPVQYQSQIFIGSDFFPKADSIMISPKPLIFIGRDNSFPANKQVQVTYYFDEIDSLIQLITFEWQPNTPGTPRHNLISHNNYYQNYKEKYISLLADFKTKLGDPDKLEEIRIEQDNYLAQSTWKYGQLNIELRLIFSAKEQEGTQLVRVKMY